MPSLTWRRGREHCTTTASSIHCALPLDNLINKGVNTTDLFTLNYRCTSDMLQTRTKKKHKERKKNQCSVKPMYYWHWMPKSLWTEKKVRAATSLLKYSKSVNIHYCSGMGTCKHTVVNYWLHYHYMAYLVTFLLFFQMFLLLVTWMQRFWGTIQTV